MSTNWVIRRLLVLAYMSLIAIGGCSDGAGGNGGTAATAGNNGTTTIPSDGPGDVNDYFPVTLGNRWTYIVATSENGHAPTEANQTISITGVKTLGGYSTAVFGYSGALATGDPTEEYYLKNNAGVFYIGADTENLIDLAINPYQELRFPLLTNDSFVQIDKTGIDFGDDLDLDGQNERVALHSQVTVVGIEAVTVPAGTFDNCMRIRTDLSETVTLSSNGATVTVTGVATEWYAPRIGLVKRHSEISATGLSRVIDYALTSYVADGQKSDNTLPTVVSVLPSAGAMLVTAGIQAVFSEEIDPATLNASTFVVRDLTGQAIPGEVTYYGKTATFTPSGAIVSGNYTATLTTGIQDTFGNPLQADYSWSFMVDRTAPTIVSTSPASNAMNVSPSGSISITFGEEIDPASLVSSITIADAAGTIVYGGGSVTYQNKTATFTPRLLNRDKLYTVTLTTGVRDLAGNGLAANYSWSFTTDAGLFQDYVALATDASPQAVAIGDVNGDGRNDVVMTTSYSFFLDDRNGYKLLVYLQDSAGGLAPAVMYATANTIACPAATVAIGDVNHDGRNDVVVGESGCGIEVFLQNAGGTLDAGLFYSSVDSDKIRIADLNHDGRLDVAGIGMGTDTVSVWLQNSGGSLDAPISYGAAHVGFGDLAVGDVNHDGLTDILVTSALGGSPYLGVLLQNVGGSFNAPAYYDVESASFAFAGVAVGDINGDGVNDVVLTYPANRPISAIGVNLQNAAGTLDPSVRFGSYDGPGAVEIADVSGDGRKDVVVLHQGSQSVGVYAQSPDGSLQPEDLYIVPCGGNNNLHGLAVGDVNGDGRNDIAVADCRGLVVLYRNSLEAPMKATPALSGLKTSGAKAAARQTSDWMPKALNRLLQSRPLR